MKTYRISFLSVVAFLILLCSLSIFSQKATACPVSFSMDRSFTAAPGGSQSKTLTITNDAYPGELTLNFTTGSDVFTVDHSSITVQQGGTVSITITFKPGASATGTLNGSLTITGNCSKTFSLVGTVSESGVSNSLPSDLLITVLPNPTSSYVNVDMAGIRSADIQVIDLLGNITTTAKANTTWKWDAANFVSGSYIIRIAGTSATGEQFVASKRVIVSK